MIELRFGTAAQSARLPAAWKTDRLRIDSGTQSRSEADTVRDAFDRPAGGRDVFSFLAGARDVVVLVSDHTRMCRSDVFLPILLEKINKADIPQQAVTLLFACGTHRRQTEAEKRAILGDHIFESYPVFDHDSRDESSAVFVGETRFGTKVYLNRRVVDASRVIATGTVVHHYFAGYGGGAKLFVPGVSSYSTAVENHRRTLTDEGRFDDRCRDGSFDGNPIAADIMDALRFTPPSYACTVLLGPDGRIIDALCGDVADVHSVARRRVDELYRIRVSEMADITIASCGGWPKDVNFIQSHKALHRAAYITKPGGSIICAAQCGDGIGSEGFLSWFGHRTRPDLAAALRESYTMNAHTAVAMRDKAERFRIYFVSNLPDQQVRCMGMTPCDTLQHAVDMASARVPSTARAYVLENASLSVPVLTVS